MHKQPFGYDGTLLLSEWETTGFSPVKREAVRIWRLLRALEVIVHIMVMCCPATSPPLPAWLHPPPRHFRGRQPVPMFSDWVYVCDDLWVFSLWTIVRWLVEGSSLVSSFVLCLNYFQSLGEEILGLASKTQDRQGIPGGFLFPSHSYSNS